MKIYVAGPSSERAAISSYMKDIRAAGHIVTHDWCAAIERADGVANSYSFSVEDARKNVEEDFQGVSDADLVWLLCFPGVSSSGAWAELGFAYASHKYTVASGEWRRSIFSKAVDAHFPQHAEAFTWILKTWPPLPPPAVEPFRLPDPLRRFMAPDQPSRGPTSYVAPAPGDKELTPTGCDHGVRFDAVAARGVPSDIVRRRWPRLFGRCPKGCGFEGVGYASKEHFVAGDW